MAGGLGYKNRNAGTLKEAVAELVAACGGQKHASELTRVGKSSIHRYTDDSDENAFSHMPVDLVRVLEKHCGEPIVTRWLAAEAGAAVVDLGEPPHRHEDYGLVLSRIGKETGALFAEGCKHLSKGRVPPGAGRLKREALALMAACAELVRDLGDPPEGVKAVRGGLSDITSDAPVGGRARLKLEVGRRYRTNNGSVVVILETKAVDRRALGTVPAGWRVLCVGRCVRYADGTLGESHIPLAWFENGFYGASADHPLTIRGVME